MEWGTRLEGPVIQKFVDMHPEFRVQRKPGTWLSADRPWQLANPDSLIAPGPRKRVDGILEAKTAGYPDGWGKEGTDEVPLHYYCQVMHYMDVLGLRWCMVAVLIGGNDYREYLVEYDADAAAELRDIGRRFLESIELGIAPDLDGGPATMRAIKELHPDIDGTTMDIPDEIGWRLVYEKSRLVVPTERFESAKNELANLMGNAQKAFWNGTKIADRRSRNGGIPYIQLASNLPVPTQVPAMPREKVTA